MILTALPALTDRTATVGRLHVEAKAAANILSRQAIRNEGAVDLILERLSKAYAVDKRNQLAADMADFLDYSWIKDVRVKHFISGLQTKVDKLSSLNLDDKLKNDLLLRQTNLDTKRRTS